MLNKYGWRQPVIRMAQPGVEPLDLEIRCKITAFSGKYCAQIEHFLFRDAKMRRMVVADS